jgi:uridine phosphorylase
MADRQQIHLRPTADVAERVLLPGDPGRALLLAQQLLEKPLMFNHHRGLWGYTGTAQDGERLTIQSTGMGGPSAAIVLHELIELGVARAIRVGTCGALDARLGLGELLVAREAIAADGTSVALGAGELALADAALSEALARESRRARTRQFSVGRIVSTDVFYDEDFRYFDARGSGGFYGEDSKDFDGESPTRARGWRAAGALAVEMEAATLFALGAARGIAVGCLLAVSDLLVPDRRRTRIDDVALTDAAEAMGAVAAAALAWTRTACR